MNKEITIYCKNTKTYHNYPVGISLLEIYNDLNIKLDYQVVAARVNYKVEDLNYLVYNPKDIEFIDITVPSGMRAYVRTLSMILSKAVHELYPSAELRIEHAISKGYYCTLDNLNEPLDEVVVKKIKERIDEIIASKKRIYQEERQREEVIALFDKANQEDKKKLFENLGHTYIRYFRIDDFIDYYVGILMPSTDYVYLYDLIPYQDGLLLRIPNKQNPQVLEEVIPQPMLFGIFKEFLEWNKIMKINNVGDFNEISKKRGSFNLIKIAEALHEKKVASVADMISRRKDVKFVLISGPSSSGKTTFSKRLSVQLAVCGLKAVTLSMDNYFVNRLDTPVDEHGEWDFEHLHALDLELFREQLKELSEGKKVELPSFSFEDGKRYYKGDTLELHEDNIVIIEGIHALNPELIPNIPSKILFKVYVSALTTISIDNHNLIPTSDVRLLRRIIRDYRYRSYSAQDTISRWASVRRGEDKWIFPYQENADVMFNSALIFELAVLKRYAEPILREVPKYCNDYTEAHRLLKFLDYFISIPDREIPPTSLLREFVGGSSFRY